MELRGALGVGREERFGLRFGPESWERESLGKRTEEREGFGLWKRRGSLEWVGKDRFGEIWGFVGFGLGKARVGVYWLISWLVVLV